MSNASTNVTTKKAEQELKVKSDSEVKIKN